jgi:carbonic anhydrase
MTPIEDLIFRARSYRANTFGQDQALYERLVSEGQSPKIMMIACSDSRVDPSIIFGSDPGQIFMVRNVASLVQPFAPDGSCHGTSAALEFGVRSLEVEHIIVLGHGHCGGINALLTGGEAIEPKSDFITPWLSCAVDIRDRLVRDTPEMPKAQQARNLEFETVRMSVQNLASFPWIKERVQSGKMALHGWHFDIAGGVISDVGLDGDPVVISG